MSQSQTTRSHDDIRRWIEQRGGHPATVTDTMTGDEPGLLRICFPEPGLERISWDEFFAKFEQEGLAFVYQDETQDGENSRFCRFVRATESANAE